MRRALALLLTLALVGLHASAFAAVRSMPRDRSDNTHYFQYDGRLFTQESSVLGPITRDDLVGFTSFTRLMPQYEKGANLVGKVKLQLLSKKRSARYQGTFTFVVRDALGEVAYSATQEADFTLRPSGRRSYSLAFGPFDLLPGDYESFTRFKAAS